MAWAYYNENDPFAASWLELLELEGHIAPGYIDRRSICDVQPDDLKEFGQCHFFAGIGGWSLALRLAGVPDDEPIWTGSCPCQPFSAAGKRKGTADKRHLWPELRRLVRERRPARVLGEQVASKDGRVWLAGVRADLEALGYAVGAADLCAAGVGAPHIRQRLYWMADADKRQRGRLADGQGREFDGQATGRQQGDGITEPSGDTGLLADTNGGLTGHRGLQPRGEHGQFAQDGCAGERLGDTDDARPQGRREHIGEHTDQRSARQASEPVRLADAMPAGRPERRASTGDRSTTWRSILIPCADGKFRRVPANKAGEPEPSLFPLAYGVRNRVGTLRGAGNAIVPQVAAEFIRATLR